MGNEGDDTLMGSSRAGHGGQTGGGRPQCGRLSAGIRPENWLSADSSQPRTKVVTVTLGDQDRPRQNKFKSICNESVEVIKNQ